MSTLKKSKLDSVQPSVSINVLNFVTLTSKYNYEQTTETCLVLLMSE